MDFGNPEAAHLELPSSPTRLPYVPAVQLIRWRGEGFSFNPESASAPGRRVRASPSCWQAKEVLGILAGNFRFHSDQGSAAGPQPSTPATSACAQNGVEAQGYPLRGYMELSLRRRQLFCGCGWGSGRDHPRVMSSHGPARAAPIFFSLGQDFESGRGSRHLKSIGSDCYASCCSSHQS